MEGKGSFCNNQSEKECKSLNPFSNLYFDTRGKDVCTIFIPLVAVVRTSRSSA